MYTIGIDVHAARSNLCILDEQGNKVRERVVQGTPRKLVEELGKFGHPFRVCYEASTCCGWLYDQLTPLAQEVMVAHPGRLRLISQSKTKNDRNDAYILAHLAKAGMIPPAYVPGAEIRAWRRTIEQRRFSVSERTAVKNQLRALLRTHAISVPKGLGLWTRKGRAWLKELAFDEHLDGTQRDLLLAKLVYLGLEIKTLTARLDTIAAKHPGVILLRTIPGIGPRTAEAFIAYVDDPHRFKRIKGVGAYFGLVPTQDQSGKTNRLGHITRQGPSSVRGLLTEAVWQGIRRSPSLKAFHERVMGDDTRRRKIAVVATAHHLARVMLSMLRSGAAWEERLVEEEPATKKTAGKAAKKNHRRGGRPAVATT